MVTITFDLAALLIGLGIGIIIGGIMFCYVEMREGGPWSQGWTDGYKCGTELRKYIEKSIGRMNDDKTD